MDKKTFFLIFIFLLGIFWMVGGGACGEDDGSQTNTSPISEETSSTVAVRPEEAVIGVQLEPTTLDLTASPQAAIPQVLLYNVYEGLIKLDKRGNYVPLLAESWEVSADNLRYTFQLRTAQFHNGASFDATDVAFSLNRTRSDPAHPFSDTLEVIETVEAIDPQTVAIRLSRYSDNLLFFLSQGQGVIFDAETNNDLATEPIGTGPFRFGEHRVGVDITLERFDDYWGDPPPLSRVRFRYISDPNALTNAMLSGDIDILAGLSAPEQVSSFQEREELLFWSGTTHGEVTLALNQTRFPLDDLRVRQAITHAIDGQAIIDGAYDGWGHPIGSPTSPLDPYYLDLNDRYPYDREAAIALLEETGYDDISLSLALPPVSYARRGGEIVASQLGEVGIDVKIEHMEWAVWLDQVFGQADYDMSIVAHVEPRDLNKYADPDYYWRYDNPEVAGWIAAADAEPDPDARLALYHDIQTQITEDAPNVWLFLLPALSIHRDNITGYIYEPFGLSLDVTDLGFGG